MGEILLHAGYGLLIYPIFRLTLNLSSSISFPLLRSRTLSALYVPDILYYGLRIVVPTIWILIGFSFGPMGYADNPDDNPKDALAFIYSMVWLFGVGTLLLKAAMDHKDR